MTAIYPLSIHRRVERRWVERIKSLRQIQAQIFGGAERSLQFGLEGPIVVKIRTGAGDRRSYRSRD